MIPYDDIIARADRRWTVALLHRLTDPKVPEGELDDLVYALQAVADPRSFALLEAIVCDRDRPALIRESASGVLHGLQPCRLRSAGRSPSPVVARRRRDPPPPCDVLDGWHLLRGHRSCNRSRSPS